MRNKDVSEIAKKDQELFKFLLLSEYSFINQKPISLMKSFSYVQLSYSIQETIAFNEFNKEKIGETSFIKIDPELFDLAYLDKIKYIPDDVMFAVEDIKTKEFFIITSKEIIKSELFDREELLKYKT
jgi:hypothetical protein